MIQVLLLLSAVSLDAEPLAKRDRDIAMSHLHATRKMFVDSLANVSKAQWEFKPAPEVWSIAEVAEHIAVSEDTLFELVSKKMLSIPPDPAKTAAAAGKDEMLLKALVDRSKKAQAPEMLKPTHRWKTAEELIEHFKQSRDRTIDFVRTTDEDLRSHVTPHPIFKELDAYQWILLIAGHSERHILQLNEVKTMSGYPAK